MGVATISARWAGRLRDWWLQRRCPGTENELLESVAIALDAMPARRAGIGPQDAGNYHIFQCTERHERCAICPRLKAYRQGLAAREQRNGHLGVMGTTHHGEAERGDRDRKVAQVDYVDSDVVGAIGHQRKARPDPHAQAVLPERTPRIEHTQHRANHG